MSSRLATRRDALTSRMGGGLAAAFGKLRGLTPASASQRISGNGSMRDEFKCFAIACQRAGRLDILTGYVEDLRLIVEQTCGKPTEASLEELSERAQQADADEDVVERRFWQTRSDRDLSQFIRQCDIAVATTLAVRAAARGLELKRMVKP